RVSQEETRPVIRLTAGVSNTIQHTDACLIYFDQNASPGFDSENDALKLMNTDIAVPNIYSIASDYSRLSINAMNEDVLAEVEIPVGVRLDNPGEITFTVSEMERITDSVHVYLKDSQLRINHDLRSQLPYKVVMEKGIYENRFQLILTTREMPHITDSDEFGVYASGETIYL